MNPFWNKIAKTWNELIEKNRDPYRTYILYPFLISKINKIKEKKILDVGCGEGYYTRIFEKNNKCIAVDLSINMIKLAKKKSDNSFYCVADASFLPFRNEVFDYIFCNLVLMDVKNIKKFYKECYRVLKEKGVLFVNITNPYVFYHKNYFKEGLKSFNFPAFDPGKIFREYKFYHRKLSSYINLLIESGFKLEGIYEIEPIKGSKNVETRFPIFIAFEAMKT